MLMAHGWQYYVVTLSSVVVKVTLITHSGSSIAQSVSAIQRSVVFEERRLSKRESAFFDVSQITFRIRATTQRERHSILWVSRQKTWHPHCKYALSWPYTISSLGHVVVFSIVILDVITGQLPEADCLRFELHVTSRSQIVRYIAWIAVGILRAET